MLSYTAISDGVLSAYIPPLEVLACDDDVVPFYERLGFTRGVAMVRRNYGAVANMTRGSM